MVRNKGKDGEMRVAKLLCEVSVKEDRCDFTRPTNTNTADGGADLVLEHPDGFEEKLIGISLGGAIAGVPLNTDTPTVKTRIDVKATDGVISPDTVDKFVGDTRKNPDCKGHALVGGKRMSKRAKENFETAQKDAKEDGRFLAYIPNSGLQNLESHYESLPTPNDPIEDDK